MYKAYTLVAAYGGRFAMKSGRIVVSGYCRLPCGAVVVVRKRNRRDFTLPGGKKDREEWNPRRVLKRELQEELPKARFTISPRPICVVRGKAPKGGYPLCVYIFRLYFFGGSLEPGREIMEMALVKKSATQRISDISNEAIRCATKKSGRY